MKRFNLIINYFCNKDADRQHEIDFCLKANAANAEIDRIIVLVAGNDIEAMESASQSEKITRIISDKRPTYNDFFQATRSYESDINAICNSDIFFDEENVLKLKKFKWLPKTCFALSRMNLTADPVDTFNSLEFEPVEKSEMKISQDAWIFWGMVPYIKGADFNLGLPGCDNSIAYLLKKAGYQLWNPCIDLISYHYHISSIRQYTSDIAKNRLPQPYLKVYPCKLEEVGISTPLWLIKRFFRTLVFHIDRHTDIFNYLSRKFR